MTVEETERAKKRPTKEQKERWKTNALMKKYDEETKRTALRVYLEAIENEKAQERDYPMQKDEKVRDYLLGDWTFDDIWDLAREFGVKPRGFHDNSWDMGEGYDGEIIDRLSDIISRIGERLTTESQEATDNLKEASRKKKVTVKELREQAKAAGIKGYSRMTKAELEVAIKKAESRRYVEEQREQKGSQWQPETSKEFNRALYGCETYADVDSLVSDQLTSELNMEHRKSQAAEYSRTEYVKFFAGLKGIRVEAESDSSEPRKEAKAKTAITEKGYFEILSAVDLGTAVNERVRMYKGVYEKLSELDSWHPGTESEASLLLGFKARNEHSDSFGVYICNDLNVIEVRDRDEAKKLFLELSREHFRKEYAYAYAELLKAKTVGEIREAVVSKGIKLSVRLRKQELIEELERHLRDEGLKSEEEESNPEADKVLRKRRRTTLEIVESLKSARNHAERLDLLRRAGIGQLKKIGKIEMMAEFGRGWTVETLSERILAQLESRYAKIDSGAAVYMSGIFGMPIGLETPLLKARRAKRERGEELDVIEREEESAEEKAREFQAGKKYKEQNSGAIATVKHRAYNMVSLELNYKGQLMPMQLMARMVDGREEIKASLDYTDKRGSWKRLKVSLKASDIVTADPKTA